MATVTTARATVLNADGDGVNGNSGHSTGTAAMAAV